jgi:hypothetical protein
MKSIVNSLRQLSPVKQVLLLVGLILTVVIGVFTFLIWRANQPPRVSNFDECAQAGYPVQESYPAVCRDYAGHSFTQKVDTSSDSPTGERQTAKDFTILVSGGNAAFSDRKNVVIKTQANWEKLWRETYAKITPFPNILPIDFTKQMVIGLYAGPKSTGGHYIKVTNIHESAAKVIVGVKEVAPGKACTVTQAVTTPHYLVATAKTDKPVEFQLTTDTQDCDASQVQP